MLERWRREGWRRGLTAVVAALALVLTGCAGAKPTLARPSSPPATASFPITLTDDDGVAVTIPAQPKRIITFAPSNTEIVFSLGLGSRLVGVSGKYDNYPPAASTITRVGGSGSFGVDPNVEKVVSLQPDLMLTISGGDQWKQRLRELHIPVFTIKGTNLADLLHDIRTVGEITGATRAALSLTGRMQAQANALQAKVNAQAPVTCFFEVYYPPLTTVGPHTFIADLLKRAGCDSVSAKAKGDYPEWSVDKLVQRSPAVYLVASESGVSPAAVAKRPGFSAIAAVRDGKIYLVDSDLVSRPGPRVVDGLAQLARLLHPEAFA
jgi:iron complex transport system substrate-binding protein